MGLLEAISARTVDRRSEQRFSVDSWLSDFLLPANEFSYNNHAYPFGLSTTYNADRAKEISNTLPGYMAALRSCPPAFGAQLVRASVLSQARFCFRNADWSPKAGRTFTTSALGLLQKPWQNATTGQLINLMEWHHGLAGNAYVTNRTPGRLRVLRPDWVVIMYGSHQQPDDAAHALDGELIGYGYCNGGIAQGRYPIETLLPGEVAHWSAEQDPECAGIGMSWITPAIREIQGDKAATDHKLRFFENGATPNMVVKGIAAANKEQFDEFVDMMETRHAGVRNAYRTLYLTTGADATVVGADLRQIDFKATQGAGETRISMLSRVHPVILGASEGLQGSSLNAGNFGAARRLWADTWIYPTLQDLAASLASMVRVPPDAELWTNTKDMPILREDARDAADIEQVKASTIVSLSAGGFTRESAVAAVTAQDMTLLVKDPNWVSVQLQQSNGAPPQAGGVAPKAPRAAVAARVFNPDEPRDPHGKWVGGGALAHKLGRMTEDDFFHQHGDDWHDQYGGGDAPRAILFNNGDAMLYHDAGKGKVDVLAKLDPASARRLGSDVAWADGHPVEKPADVKNRPGGLVESRETALGGTVGYGYDPADGFLFTRLTLPTASGKPKTFDIVDEDNAASFAKDMQSLANDIDGKTYAGPRAG